MRIVIAALALYAAVGNAAWARSAPESFADLADELSPVVVNISTTQKVPEASNSGRELEDLFRDFLERQNPNGEQNQPRERQAQSLGSGFIVDPEGYVVTNNHVIENAEEITVTTHDNRELKAKLVGVDEKTDLALLKVEAGEKLPASKWGNSDKLRVGDWIVAIGNPFGLGGTVTAGIVSARQRDIQIGQYDDFIQTDASINRGNSGGPMFNTDGEVVGINTIIISPSGGSIGIGFAISANLAQPVIAQLKEHGKVRRALLGVSLQAVTPELAEGLRLPASTGALIADVTDGGPADKAGIKQGDVVLEFNHQPIKEMRNLPRLVAESPIGKQVPLVVSRKGQKMTISVVLGELQDTEPQAKNTGAPSSTTPSEQKGQLTLSSLGLTVNQLDADTKSASKLDAGVEGVLVTSVDSAGPAAAKGITSGDVIVEVDQKSVRSPKEIEARVKEAVDSGYRIVTLLINRQGSFNWVAVKIAKP